MGLSNSPTEKPLFKKTDLSRLSKEDRLTIEQGGPERLIIYEYRGQDVVVYMDWDYNDGEKLTVGRIIAVLDKDDACPVSYVEEEIMAELEAFCNDIDGINKQGEEEVREEKMAMQIREEMRNDRIL